MRARRAVNPKAAVDWFSLATLFWGGRDPAKAMCGGCEVVGQATTSLLLQCRRLWSLPALDVGSFVELLKTEVALGRALPFATPSTTEQNLRPRRSTIGATCAALSSTSSARASPARTG